MRKNNYIRHSPANTAVALWRNNEPDKNLLKSALWALALLALILLLPLLIGGIPSVFGADDGKELTQNIQSILDGLDLSEIQSYLDQYGNEYLLSYGSNAREVVEYLIKGDFGVNYSDYVGKLLSTLFKGVTAQIPAFAQVVAISLLCAISSDAEGGILGKTTAKTIRLACTSLIMLILSSVLVGLVSTGVACINSLKRQIEIITPILVTLTVLTGGSDAGAVFQPSALFLSGGAIEIVSGLIFPATVAVIVLNFLSKLNPQISFSGSASLIKSIMKWVIGITVTVFGLFLTVQSTASSLFNGIFFKVTKYLVGNSVPIVGNFLSAGVDMVVMAGSLVRSSVGALGIVMLVSEIIQPIVVLVAFSLILKITGAIVQPLGEKSLFALFSDLSKDVEYILAGILMVSFMYFLIVMLAVNSANYFI